MKPSAGYLIPKTSAEDLRTILQIQAQTLGQISKSSAESFRYAAGYPKLRYQTGCSNQPRYKPVSISPCIKFCNFCETRPALIYFELSKKKKLILFNTLTTKLLF